MMTIYQDYEPEFLIQGQASDLKIKFLNKIFNDVSINRFTLNELSDTNVKLLKEMYKTIKNRLIRKGHSYKLIHKVMSELWGAKGYTESYANFHRNTNQSNVVHIIEDMKRYEGCVKGTDYVERFYETFWFRTAASPITVGQIMLAVKALGLSVSRTSVNRIKEKANDKETNH